jgi:hypothetical protein
MNFFNNMYGIQAFDNALNNLFLMFLHKKKYESVYSDGMSDRIYTPQGILPNKYPYDDSLMLLWLQHRYAIEVE